MKGVIKSVKNSIFTIFASENRGEIEIDGGSNKQAFYFKKRVWNYIVHDNKNNIILRSKLLTNSIVKRFLGIAPIVFYDINDQEIVKINNHHSIKKHSIVFDSNIEIQKENGKYYFAFGCNTISLNETANQIEFECEEKYLFHIIAVSITMWNSYNQAP